MNNEVVWNRHSEAALASTGIPALVFNRELVLVYFTPSIASVFNLTPNDIGQSLDSFVNSHLPERFVEAALLALESSPTTIEQISLVTGHSYLARVLPINDANNHISGVMMTFDDITATVKAEQGLRWTEERYRLLVANALEYAIIFFDPQGYLTVWNRGAERITGFVKDEVLGRYGDFLFTEEDRRAGIFELEMATAMAVGHANDDRWQQRADGTRFWANGSMIPLRETGGDLRGFAKVLRDNTDYYTNANSLREAEWRLRQALEAAELGTWSYVPADKIVEIDARSQAILGVDQSVVSAAQCRAMIHPDQLAEFLEAGKIAFDPRGPGTFDHTQLIIRPDGEKRWIRGFARVFFAGEGDARYATRAVGVVSDVTRQLQFQLDLQESESRYRALFESIDEGFCVTEVKFDDEGNPVDYRFLEANPAFATHTGIHNATGKWILSIAPNIERHWIDTYGRVAKTGVPERFTADSAELDHRCFDVYAFRIGTPEECKVAILFTDITARKRDEEALRASETRLRLAAQATGFGSYDRQLEPETCVWSPEMYRIFGIPTTVKPSRDRIIESIVPRDRDQYIELLESCLIPDDYPYHDVELEIIRGDGQRRWIRDIGHTWFAGEGKNRRAARLVGMVQDITEQKEFERSLEVARSKAEAANRMRGEFLANMSHEIRTPMAAILGYADVLLENLTDADDRSCVQVMKRNGQHLLEVINDILDLSRIEAGKFDITCEWCQLTELVRDVHALMLVRANEKKLRFVFEYENPVPERIQTDPTRLRQILFNLLGNAMKFTEQGDVCLSVAYFVDAGRPMLRICVRDTGIGMSEEQQNQLFQPFSQGDSSVTRAFGGSGLGLAISKRLTHMLHGELTYTSQLGIGSTFCVELPIGTLDGVEFIMPTMNEVVSEHPSAPPETRRLDCRVLVVDDRRDVRYISQHFLEKAGAVVVAAENGKDGVDMAIAARESKQAFDVIIMDMQMPVMDGLGATAKLRAAGIEQPIIALTADAMKGDRQRYLRAGCDDYLSKPIDHAELVTMVARYAHDLSLDTIVELRKSAK